MSMLCGLILMILVRCNAQLLYGDEESDIRNELGLYKNLEEVLNVFKSDTSTISKQILKAFHSECMFTEDTPLPTGKRKPFIVIEGSHRPSRESIGSKLANLLDGRYITQLPPCLKRFSLLLGGGSPLRRPLHFLALYASAFEARVHITLSRAVVVNGYWTDQLAYTVTRSFHAGALPPLSAEFFNYPVDLMQPDLLIFLDFGESLCPTTPATTRFYQISNVRKTTNLQKRKLEMYRHLQETLPIHIHQLRRVSNRVTASQLLEVVRTNLSKIHTFDPVPLWDY